MRLYTYNNATKSFLIYLNITQGKINLISTMIQFSKSSSFYFDKGRRVTLIFPKMKNKTFKIPIYVQIIPSKSKNKLKNNCSENPIVSTTHKEFP